MVSQNKPLNVVNITPKTLDGYNICTSNTYTTNLYRGQTITIGFSWYGSSSPGQSTLTFNSYPNNTNVVAIFNSTADCVNLPKIDNPCSSVVGDSISYVTYTVPVNCPYGIGIIVGDGAGSNPPNWIWFNVIPGVVTEVKELDNRLEVESILYFDVMGKEVKDPILETIYIRKITYVNGYVENTKVIIQ